jgi:hypothetical protein
MATANKTVNVLSGEQVAQLLALTKSADSVELKLTIPDSDQRATLMALGIDPLDAEVRQVFFFDTPDLQLNAAGVVARARRIQGKPSDAVVKLRPVEPDGLPRELRKNPSFGVEVDTMPGGFVCSGSLKGVLGTNDVREVSIGNGSIRSLFSKEQRALFKEHAPAGIKLDQLSILGPIFVLKIRILPVELNRKMVAEIWLYPDDTHLLELSTKCAPTETFQVAVELRAYLASHNINVSGEQETKTRKALDYFSRVLQTNEAQAAKPAPDPAKNAARAAR